MRRATLAIGILWAWVAAAMPLQAQTGWPSKDVRIVAPFPAGAPADQIVRMIAGPLQAAWSDGGG